MIFSPICAARVSRQDILGSPDKVGLKIRLPAPLGLVGLLQDPSTSQAPLSQLQHQLSLFLHSILNFAIPLLAGDLCSKAEKFKLVSRASSDHLWLSCSPSSFYPSSDNSELQFSHRRSRRQHHYLSPPLPPTPNPPPHPCWGIAELSLVT